jgi:DNA-binding CsgD family transcriptional regulator
MVRFFRLAARSVLSLDLMTMQNVAGSWSPQCFAAVVGGPGRRDFGAALLRLAQDTGPIVEAFAFAWSPSGGPRLIAVEGSRPGAESRARAYVERYFHHDPMLFQHRGTKVEAGFNQNYGVGEIGPGEYRTRCFVAPGFAEKISFGWRWSAELSIVSFYAETSGSTDFDRLRALAHVALASMGLCHDAGTEKLSRADLRKAIEDAAPALSAREAEVCLLTILGYRSGAIAAKLSISQTSVLTYRRRAYQKAGVSCAGELLRLGG